MDSHRDIAEAEMRTVNRLARNALVLVMSGLAPAGAHQAHESEQAVVSAEQLSDRAWCLFGPGGNVGVLLGPEAILMIDDQYDYGAPSLRAKVASISPLPIRYLVNTHFTRWRLALTCID
ncbi:MAG TPA: hypothetical protein VGB99_10995 [Acidobacteriota bacterium]